MFTEALFVMGWGERKVSEGPPCCVPLKQGWDSGADKNSCRDWFVALLHEARSGTGTIFSRTRFSISSMNTASVNSLQPAAQESPKRSLLRDEIAAFKLISPRMQFTSASYSLFGLLARHLRMTFSKLEVPLDGLSKAAMPPRARHLKDAHP